MYTFVPNLFCVCSHISTKSRSVKRTNSKHNTNETPLSIPNEIEYILKPILKTYAKLSHANTQETFVHWQEINTLLNWKTYTKAVVVYILKYVFSLYCTKPILITFNLKISNRSNTMTLFIYFISGIKYSYLHTRVHTRIHTHARAFIIPEKRDLYLRYFYLCFVSLYYLLVLWSILDQGKTNR